MKIHPIIWITTVAVLLRVGLGIHLYQQYGILSVNNGDYDLYAIGAAHIQEQGNFGNSLFLPRPPLFPLIILILGQAPLVVLSANALIGGLTTLLVYAVARRLDLTIGLLAALLFALDPLTISKGASLLDPLPWHAFGITGMIAALLTLRQASQRRWLWALIAGLCFSLAVLTRPESFLIWTGLTVWLLITQRNLWRPLLLYTLICGLTVLGWTWHNGQVFGHYTFSSVGPFTMAFYRAASVQHQATGEPMEAVYLDITRRVETAIGHDPEAATDGTRWGYHAASPEVASALQAVSIDIFRSYPREYVLTLGIGALRMFGLEPSLQSPGEFILFVWNGMIMLLALVGWLRLLIERRWLAVWLVLLVVGYYTTGTLLVKNAALEGRERAVLNPYIMICAAVALDWLYRRWHSRQAQTAK